MRRSIAGHAVRGDVRSVVTGLVAYLDESALRGPLQGPRPFSRLAPGVSLRSPVATSAQPPATDFQAFGLKSVASERWGSGLRGGRGAGFAGELVEDGGEIALTGLEGGEGS